MLSPSQLKKIEILEASLNLISDSGYQAFSLTNIQRESGIAKALIRYHYPSLNHILQDLMIQLSVEGQNLASLDSEDSPVEIKISNQIYGSFQWAKNQPKWSRFFSFIYYAAQFDKELYRMHQETLSKGLARFNKNISKISPKISKKKTEQHSLACQNLLIGSILRMSSVQDFDNIEKYAETCVISIEKILEITIPRKNLI